MSEMGSTQGAESADGIALTDEQRESVAEAVRVYLRLYLLPANVGAYWSDADDHGTVAERCAPLLVEHVFPPVQSTPTDTGERP